MLFKFKFYIRVKPDEKVISEDNFQKFLRNLVPISKEFIAYSDIFGASGSNLTIRIVKFQFLDGPPYVK